MPGGPWEDVYGRDGRLVGRYSVSASNRHICICDDGPHAVSMRAEAVAWVKENCPNGYCICNPVKDIVCGQTPIPSRKPEQPLQQQQLRKERTMPDDQHPAPWEASDAWGDLCFAVALALEANPQPGRGAQSIFGDQVAGGGTSSADVDWPGGSPTNWSLMRYHKFKLDDGSESEDIDVTDARGGAPQLDSDYGSRGAWQPYTSSTGYLYAIRDVHGAPHPVHEADVLAKIGRSHGQTGK